MALCRAASMSADRTTVDTAVPSAVNAARARRVSSSEGNVIVSELTNGVHPAHAAYD